MRAGELDYSVRVPAPDDSHERADGGPDGQAPAPPAGMSGPPGPLLRFIRDRRVAFVIVGSINTLVGLGWFVLFEFLVGRHLGPYGYLVTLGLAHVASVLCAFVLYRRFVYRVRGHVWRDLARFELVYLVSIAINFALLPLLVELGGLDPIPAQFLIVIVTTVTSYLGHGHFSFRRPAPATREDQG